MTVNIVLDEERTIDGARVVFLSAEVELNGELEIVIASARIKQKPRFVSVTPFVGDVKGAPLVPTSVVTCGEGVVKFKASARGKVRFDVLVR